MKKAFVILFCCFFILMLSSCSVLRNIGANIGIIDTVKIDGVTYRTGFYDSDLWPDKIEHKGDPYKIGRDTYRRVDCERFDLVHNASGSIDNKTLFCAESQWEEARAYYADSSKFLYYCRIGGYYVDRDPIVVAITDIDPDKFSELMVFAEKNGYEPLGSNKGKQTLRLPIPDRDESPELVFFRESNDGFFSSFTHMFHVIDDKLLLVFYYDYGYGEYEELVAVEVPDELGRYFIELPCVTSPE